MNEISVILTFTVFTVQMRLSLDQFQWSSIQWSLMTYMVQMDL